MTGITILGQRHNDSFQNKELNELTTLKMNEQKLSEFANEDLISLIVGLLDSENLDLFGMSESQHLEERRWRSFEFGAVLPQIP